MNPDVIEILRSFDRIHSELMDIRQHTDRLLRTRATELFETMNTKTLASMHKYRTYLEEDYGNGTDDADAGPR